MLRIVQNDATTSNINETMQLKNPNVKKLAIIFVSIIRNKLNIGDSIELMLPSGNKQIIVDNMLDKHANHMKFAMIIRNIK